MTNVVVLVGRLARPAAERVLPSGDRLVNFEVTVPREGERADSVPVSWFEAPAAAGGLDTGEEVVVVGRVRRRFFQTPAGTQSRTEVAAEAVIPRRHTKRAGIALARAAALVDEAGQTAAPSG